MAWYLLGECLEQQSETDKGVAAWRNAIAVDPNFSQALFAWRTPCARQIAPSRTSSWRATPMLQKQRRILDRARLLANNGVVAAQAAHDWPEATRQLKGAIA